MTEKLPLDFLLSATDTSDALWMDERSLNYGELLREVRKRACFFQKCGLKKGDKAAVYTDISLESVKSLFAMWMIGAVFIPVNITQHHENIKEIESIVRPDFGFYSPDYDMGFKRDFPSYTFENTEESKPKLSTPSPQDRAIIMFTSGSSGLPKAVPITYGAIAHNALETSKRLNIKHDDKILINTPMYYTSSIIHVLTMMAGGASIVVSRDFLFGSNILNLIEKHGCTGFGGVPVHFLRLISSTSFPDKLRFLMNSGDHLPLSVLKKLRKTAPSVKIYCAYGLTEAAGRLCILDADKLGKKMGSVGLPIDGMSVTIRSDKGEKLEHGESGEVYIKGRCLMRGYINNQEIDNSYGFATGDIGHLDKEGYLFLEGRRDDIFKVAGEKVSTKIIEDAVSTFEDFIDFNVSPVYEENAGNVPYLYYVMKKDIKFNRLKLLRHLKKRLPPLFMPVRFVERDVIKRTGSGKVMS